MMPLWKSLVLVPLTLFVATFVILIPFFIVGRYYPAALSAVSFIGCSAVVVFLLVILTGLIHAGIRRKENLPEPVWLWDSAVVLLSLLGGWGVYHLIHAVLRSKTLEHWTIGIGGAAIFGLICLVFGRIANRRRKPSSP